MICKITRISRPTSFSYFSWIIALTLGARLLSTRRIKGLGWSPNRSWRSPAESKIQTRNLGKRQI